MWLATKDGLSEKHSFTGGDGGILSLVSRNGTIYAGCQDGQIKMWDQDTKTLLRTLIVEVPVSEHPRANDVLSLSMVEGDLYACMGNGWCQRWSSSLQSTALWKAHDGISLSCVITSPLGHEHEDNKLNALLLTGGADSEIKVNFLCHRSDRFLKVCSSGQLKFLRNQDRIQMWEISRLRVSRSPPPNSVY
jgi:di- and tripeptidase